MRQITTHQRDRSSASTLDGFNSVPSGARVHTLCIGGMEPHGTDTSRSTGILDRSDQMHDVATTTGLWDDDYTS
jgi:hypothetical protein